MKTIDTLGVGRRPVSFTEHMDRLARHGVNTDSGNDGTVDGPDQCHDPRCPNASARHTEDGCFD